MTRGFDAHAATILVPVISPEHTPPVAETRRTLPRQELARLIVFAEAPMLALIAIYLLTLPNYPVFVFSAAGAPLLLWGAWRMRDDKQRTLLGVRRPHVVAWDWTDLLIFFPGAFTAGQVLGSITVYVAHSFVASGDPTVRNAVEGFVNQAAYYAGALFNLWVLVGLRRGGRLGDLGWRGFRWWWTPLVVLGAYVTLQLAGLLQLLMQQAFPSLPNTQCQVVQHDYSHFLALALIIVVVFAPLAEETIFRGFAYAGLRSLLPVPLAVVTSAAIFSLAHGVPLLMLPLFAVGCILALFYQGSRSIFPGVLVHALFNLPGIITILSVKSC
jgi:membrane protease YdiL (CAAX protease family)